MKKTPRSDSDTKLEDAASPQRGQGKYQLLATLCVASSPALFALGNADPTSEFCLRTLSFVGATPTFCNDKILPS
jgi:hypothetical protein